MLLVCSLSLTPHFSSRPSFFLICKRRQSVVSPLFEDLEPLRPPARAQWLSCCTPHGRTAPLGPLCRGNDLSCRGGAFASPHFIYNISILCSSQSLCFFHPSLIPSCFCAQTVCHPFPSFPSFLFSDSLFQSKHIGARRPRTLPSTAHVHRGISSSVWTARHTSATVPLHLPPFPLDFTLAL